MLLQGGAELGIFDCAEEHDDALRRHVAAEQFEERVEGARLDGEAGRARELEEVGVGGLLLHRRPGDRQLSEAAGPQLARGGGRVRGVNSGSAATAVGSVVQTEYYGPAGYSFDTTGEAVNVHLDSQKRVDAIARNPYKADASDAIDFTIGMPMGKSYRTTSHIWVRIRILLGVLTN